MAPRVRWTYYANPDTGEVIRVDLTGKVKSPKFDKEKFFRTHKEIYRRFEMFGPSRASFVPTVTKRGRSVRSNLYFTLNH